MRQRSSANAVHRECARKGQENQEIYEVDAAGDLMRYPQSILKLMINSGVDLSKFFSMEPGEIKDYEELGLPAQGVAVRLRLEGVLDKAGWTKAGRNKGYRNLWKSGCNYEMLRQYSGQYFKESESLSAMQPECEKEMAV